MKARRHVCIPGGGGRCTQFVHGRRRMTIGLRIHPYYAGTEHVGFSPTRGGHCLHQARSAVRCSASRMKGELHPSTNRSYKDGLRHLVPTFLASLWMTAPTRFTLFSGVATPSREREAATVCTMYNCLVGVPCCIHTT